MRKQAGFTLMELLIVIAIISILASIGYSSYSGYISEARRGEAVASLMEISQAQEKYFLDNNQYAADRATLGIDQYTSGGHYQVTVSSSDTSRVYEVLAQPKTGGAQTSDTACASMRLFSDGRRTPTECWE